MAREVGQEQAITANLVSPGDLQFQREQLEAARALYSQAQLRSGAAGEMALAAEALLRLALVDREQGLHEAASGSARAALETAREIQATVIESQAWYALGESARARQDNEAAFEAYAAAESAAGGIGDPELLWQLHYGRAQTHEQAGDLEKAIRELTAAVQVIESVRERLSEQRFRAGWVEDKYQVYVDLVRLQLELGRVQQAFSTAERLRARSFLAQLDRSPRAELSGENQRKEAALRERIRQLQAYLAEEQQRLLPQRRQLAIDSFSGELMQAEREYQAFLDDQGAGLNPMQSVIVPQLEDIQRSLKPGDALIEYVVDEEKLMIFLVRPDRLTAVTASLPRPQLEARIDLVRELVAQPGSPRWVKPATSLSGYLLGPLQQDELLAGVRHLKLVPHGILNYLPFALLPVDDSGEQLLMEAFTLSYLPAAAALLRQEQARERQPAMLALAPEVARLRFAPSEARSVAAMFEPNARLLEGSTATETALKAQAADFQVLHFATHGVFNKNNPLLSGLELEADEQNDGLLEVHEILGLSLNAELVSLSACQTGLGSGWFNDIPAGDDFVGLTRAFLFSGSSVVLASLWEVDDRSTVSLMEGFYRHLGKDSADRGHAAALARVQRELRASKEFSHPFYWAPFVLVGQHRTAAPLLSQRG
jgi:CHAT domain-containing protein